MIQNTQQFKNYINYLRHCRPPHTFWGETDPPNNLFFLEEGPGFDPKPRARTKKDFNMNEVIYNFSIPRSGSTLIRQIMSEIFDYEKIIYFYKIPRFKNFNDDNVRNPIVMTCRDFRDVILSTRRMRLSMHGVSAEESFAIPPTEEELQLLATREVIPQINGLNYIFERYQDDILLLKYEDFKSDFDYIFEKFEEFFNRVEYAEIIKSHGYDGSFRIDDEKRSYIKQEYCFDNNYKKAQGTTFFSSWDKSNLSGLALHSDHMSFGNLQEWKFLNHKASQCITDVLGAHLGKWGYEEK